MEVQLHGTLWSCFLVGCSVNFETNNGQNHLKLYRYQRIPRKVACVKGKVSTTFTSGFRLVLFTGIKLSCDHLLTQCYLFEFYRNFKLMLTTPKMLETRPKATSTSYQTATLPEAPLAEIQTRPAPKLTKKKHTPIFTILTNVKSN